jgi:hypothetical protein
MNDKLERIFRGKQVFSHDGQWTTDNDNDADSIFTDIVLYV